MHDGERGDGGILVLLADGEVELLDVLVELLRVSLAGTLVFDEVVDVEAHGADLAAELVAGLGPVRLVDVCHHVLVQAGDGLLGARRGLGGGQLLEREAGGTFLAGGLGDVKIAGLIGKRETEYRSQILSAAVASWKFGETIDDDRNHAVSESRRGKVVQRTS